MKNCAFTIMLLFLFHLLPAQILTIHSRDTRAPIERVTVMSESPEAFGMTDTHGQVDVSAFQGAAKITIRCLGYAPVELSYRQLDSLGYALGMVPSPGQMEEIVVSASRMEEENRHLPFRIARMTSRQSAFQNPQTAADLLGSSGEVFIQKSQQGGGSPMIRGFATNRLVYTVDGIRMNTAIFRAGNIQNVISLDPLSIRRTEVLFGPASVIYGSDAIGGVMCFLTLAPQFSTENKLLISGKSVSRFSSTNQELTQHLDLNTGWQKWALVTSLTYSRYGDLRMGSHGPESYLKRFAVQRIDDADRVVENPDPLVQNPSGYGQINLMQKIAFRPTGQWEAGYDFHYSETTPYARYDRLLETRENGLPVSALWQYGPQKWTMHHLSFDYNRRNILWDKMRVRLAWQIFEESRIDRRFNHYRRRTQLENVQAWSGNADGEKICGRHLFHYGVEFVRNRIHSEGSAVDIRDGSPIAVPDRYPASDWTSYAAYLSYRYAFSDRLLALAGVRYNVFDLQADFTRHLSFFPFDFTRSRIRNAATTGQLGLVFHLNPGLKTSAHLSTGFRAPNVDDLGKIFDFVSGEVIVPNSSLQPEYAYHGELSVVASPVKYFQFDLTGFYTFLDQAMVRRPFRVSGQDSIVYDGVLSRVYAIQNAAFARIYGFGAGVDIQLLPGLTLTSRYNYQWGEEEMDDSSVARSRHAAPAFGTTRLTLARDSVTLQWYAVYSAAVPFDDLNPEERSKPFLYAEDGDCNPWSPGWYTLNFKAMYAFRSHWTISGGVENLTDRRYRPYSSGLAAPGRNFILAISAKF